MKKALPWIILVAAIAVVAIWYFDQYAGAPQPPPEEPPLAESVAAEPAVEYPVEPPVAEQEPAEEPAPEPMPAPKALPSLAESDPVVRSVLVDVLGVEPVTRRIVADALVSRFVATVDNLMTDEVAPLMVPVTPAPDTFKVRDTDTGEVVIDDGNFARYEPYVAMLEATEPQVAVEIYREHYPLFQQAYADLGYPDAYFNDRLVEVIDHLLTTPRPERPLALVKPEAFYEFADADLEALSAGQKLLLRIGPENGEVVRDYLLEVRAILTRPADGDGSGAN